jgi:cleavage and polyadenylation specificity factor subunit 4
MDGDDSHLVFDFEETLDADAAAGSASVVVGAASASASDALAPAAVGPHHDQGRSSRSSQQTVCRHWLRALCMKGDSCEFLHQYDNERMSVCHSFRSYGDCRELDCLYKHNAEPVKECSM